MASGGGEQGARVAARRRSPARAQVPLQPASLPSCLVRPLSLTDAPDRAGSSATADAAAAAAPAQQGLWTRVADCGALAHDGARLHVAVADADGRARFVSVIRHSGGQLSCLDSTCYHAGGPLTAGDIEDVEGQACVSCPWHAYKVTIATGEKLYRATELVDGKLIPAGWRSVGPRQRVHEVREAPGEGLLVRLSLGGKALESDAYAHNAAWLLRCLGAALREAERQTDVVAEILAPGPLGPPAVKWSRKTQLDAEEAVRAAKRRWVQTQPRGAACVEATTAEAGTQARVPVVATPPPQNTVSAGDGESAVQRRSGTTAV